MMIALRTPFALAASLVAAALLAETPARALTPTVAWTQSGLPSGATSNAIFSSDGTALLLHTSAGIELRRASDGTLLEKFALSADDQQFEAVALSPDNHTLALGFFVNAVGKIELWNMSTGALTRTIVTDAVRDIRGLSFSSAGLIASQERFAYGGGGFLRIYKASDGSLVKKTGPTVRNSTTRIGFSPNGSYLAITDNVSINGVSVLRTSDWQSVLSIGAGTFDQFFAWSPDGLSLWTANLEQVHIPDGALIRQMPTNVSAAIQGFTPDGKFAFAGGINGTTNEIGFLRTSDAGVQVLYTFTAGTLVGGGQINSAGTLFTYETCPDTCTLSVAKVPAL